MPDHRGRRKTDGPAFFLNSPANIYVVAGSVKNRIKSADLIEARLPKCHIASGYMFGNGVCQQYVHRTAWGSCYTLRDGRITGRREIGTSNHRMRGMLESAAEIIQPVAIGVRVIIYICDDFAARRFRAGVSRS